MADKMGKIKTPTPPAPRTSHRPGARKVEKDVDVKLDHHVEARTTAEALGAAQREISVAEFFEKNKHLLGYENPAKSLLTVVKEAFDNALDACEEARILPDIYLEIKQVEGTQDRFKVIIEDNGPGIVKKNLARVFGKLLYGSKFHKLKMARGQQGIGISGAVLYSQLTTGKPTKIYSRIGDGKVHVYELLIDVRKNEPEVVSESEAKGAGSGVRIEMEIKGDYRRGKQSVYEYVRETAIMNPYAKITFVDPDSNKFDFPRAVKQLPPEPKEIQPHPAGVELGVLIRMMRETKARNIVGFLSGEFSRISSAKANEVCAIAKVDAKVSPRSVTREEAERLHGAMQQVKLQAPPTDCLSPIGEKAIEEGLKKELSPEFVKAVTRSPAVYRGNPFQIEAAVAFGGGLAATTNGTEGAAGGEAQPATIMRFANKVPLLYDQSACAMTKAILQTDWRRYGLSQPSGALPVGPVAFLVHIASVWVPFTSEGKTAIASYPEILKEIKLALQDCGRQLQLYLGRKLRKQLEMKKREMFKIYGEELAEHLAKLTNKSREEILKRITKVAEKLYEAGEIEEGGAEVVEEKKEIEEGEEEVDVKKSKGKK